MLENIAALAFFAFVFYLCRDDIAEARRSRDAGRVGRRVGRQSW